MKEGIYWIKIMYQVLDFMSNTMSNAMDIHCLIIYVFPNLLFNGLLLLTIIHLSDIN